MPEVTAAPETPDDTQLANGCIEAAIRNIHQLSFSLTAGLEADKHTFTARHDMDLHCVHAEVPTQQQCVSEVQQWCIINTNPKRTSEGHTGTWTAASPAAKSSVRSSTGGCAVCEPVFDCWTAAAGVT